MKYLGAHVSASGGMENAPPNAQEIHARGFALFTKNQRQWSARSLSEANIQAFQDNLAKLGIAPEQVLPHDSYFINPGPRRKGGVEKIALGLSRRDAALCAIWHFCLQLPVFAGDTAWH